MPNLRIATKSGAVGSDKREGEERRAKRGKEGRDRLGVSPHMAFVIEEIGLGIENGRVDQRIVPQFARSLRQSDGI